MPRKTNYTLYSIDSIIHPKALLEKFNCGNDQINHFLKVESLTAKSRNELLTFVLIDNDKKKIAGFLSSAVGQLDLKPKQDNDAFERESLSFINLAYFSIDADYQGKGLGRSLFVEFIRMCITASLYSKVSLIYLESVDESVKFYHKMGLELVNRNNTPERQREYGNDTSKISFPMLVNIDALIDNGYLPYECNFNAKSI